MVIKKPMLAVNAVLDKIVFPTYVTPKLDGIRCLKMDGRVLSRKFKDIPNDHIRNALLTLPDGLDGEIMAGATFNECQSLVMTKEGQPAFTYYVFDVISEESYLDRMDELETLELPGFCKKLFPTKVINIDMLTKIEDLCVDIGFEGIMLRSPTSPYKQGRSTMKEGYLLKVKRFMDAEATVVGFEEKMHNANEATTDELGHTKRSSHKANQVPAGTLGSLLVKSGNLEFSIGSGFDDATRKHIWDNKDAHLGLMVTYKYQEAGKKLAPRFPVFKGFRSEDDCENFS